MKFSVNKNILQKHLTEHSKVVPLRTTLPVLSCAVFSVKEQKLTIKTSDLEQTIISFFDVGVEKEGSVAVPLSKLLEIVSATQEKEIKISSNEDFLIEINNNKGSYKITGRPAEEFPETPQTKTKEKLEFDGKQLINIINKTTFAASKDELKPALCGVYFKAEKETLIAVATDGHKLVKTKTTTNKKTEQKTSLVIPVKFLNIIKNIYEPKEKIILNISDNHIEVEQQTIKVLSRIIKDNFPDFNSVIPESNTTKITINTEDVLSSLKRVSIFSNKTTKQVVLSCSSKGITITTQDIETSTSAKEHVDCSFDGEEITTSFNAKYLTEIIQHLESEEITIHLNTALTAALFVPKAKEKETKTTSLLMPIRITQ